MAGLGALFQGVSSKGIDTSECSNVCRPSFDEDSHLEEKQETRNEAHVGRRAKKTWVRHESEAVNARTGGVDELEVYELLSRSKRPLAVEYISYCWKNSKKGNPGLELRKGASAYFTEIGTSDITNENNGPKFLAEGDETRQHEAPFGAVSEEIPHVMKSGWHGRFFNEQATVFEVLAEREAPHNNPFRREILPESRRIAAKLTFEWYMESTERDTIYHKLRDCAKKNSPAKVPSVIRFALRRLQLSSQPLYILLQRLREDSLSVPISIRWQSYGSVVYDVHHQGGTTTPANTYSIFTNEISPQSLILRASLWNLYHEIEDGVVPLGEACWNIGAIRMEESPDQSTVHCYWKHDIDEVDADRLVDFVVSCGSWPYHLPHPRHHYLEPHLRNWRPSSLPQSMVPWVAEHRTLSFNQRRTLRNLAEIVRDYRCAELHLTPTDAALAVMMFFRVGDEFELVQQLQRTKLSPIKLATYFWLILTDSLSVKPAWSFQPELHIANQALFSPEAEFSEPISAVFNEDIVQTLNTKARKPAETHIEPPKLEVRGCIFDMLKVAEDSGASAPGPDGENLNPELDQPSRFSSPEWRAVVRRVLDELPNPGADGCKFFALGKDTESIETEAATADEKKNASHRGRAIVRQTVRMQRRKRKRHYPGRSPDLVMNSNTPATRPAPVSPLPHLSGIIRSNLSLDIGTNRQCVHRPPSGEFSLAAESNDPWKMSIITLIENMFGTQDVLDALRIWDMEAKLRAQQGHRIGKFILKASTSALGEGLGLICGENDREALTILCRISYPGSPSILAYHESVFDHKDLLAHLGEMEHLVFTRTLESPGHLRIWAKRLWRGALEATGFAGILNDRDQELVDNIDRFVHIPCGRKFVEIDKTSDEMYWVKDEGTQILRVEMDPIVHGMFAIHIPTPDSLVDNAFNYDLRSFNQRTIVTTHDLGCFGETSIVGMLLTTSKLVDVLGRFSEMRSNPESYQDFANEILEEIGDAIRHGRAQIQGLLDTEALRFFMDIGHSNLHVRYVNAVIHAAPVSASQTARNGFQDTDRIDGDGGAVAEDSGSISSLDDEEEGFLNEERESWHIMKYVCELDTDESKRFSKDEINGLAHRIGEQIMEYKQQVESSTLERKRQQDEPGHGLKTRGETEFSFQRLNGEGIVEDRLSTTLPDLIDEAFGDEETGFEDEFTVSIGFTDLNDSPEPTLRNENNLDSQISKAKKQVKFEKVDKQQLDDYWEYLWVTKEESQPEFTSLRRCHQIAAQVRAQYGPEPGEGQSSLQQHRQESMQTTLGQIQSSPALTDSITPNDTMTAASSTALTNLLSLFNAKNRSLQQADASKSSPVFGVSDISPYAKNWPSPFRTSNRLTVQNSIIQCDASKETSGGVGELDFTAVGRFGLNRSRSNTDILGWRIASSFPVLDMCSRLAPTESQYYNTRDTEILNEPTNDIECTEEDLPTLARSGIPTGASQPCPKGVHLDIFDESLVAQSEDPVHVSSAASVSGPHGPSFMFLRPKHRKSISGLVRLFAQIPHMKKHALPAARSTKNMVEIRGGGSTTSLSSKDTELSEDPEATSKSGSFSHVGSDTPADFNEPGDEIHPSDPRRHVPEAADNEWSSMSFQEARDQAARNARLDRVPFADYMQQRRRVRIEIKEAIVMDQKRNEQRDVSRAAAEGRTGASGGEPGSGTGAGPEFEVSPPGPPAGLPPGPSPGSYTGPFSGPTPGPYSGLTPGMFSGPTLGSHSGLFSGSALGPYPGPASGLPPGPPPTPSSVPFAGASSKVSPSPRPRARTVQGAALRTDSEKASSADRSSSFLSHFNGSNGPSSSSSSASSLHKLFDSYRDNVKQEPDRIGVEGSIRYLEDLGLKLDEPTVLAVLTELNAPTMGEFTRDGFVDGWTLLHADTLSKQKQAIPKLRNDLTSNPDVFKRTYKATFLLARQPSQKILPLDVAIEHWQLLFSPPSINWSTNSTPWLKWWIEFLQEKYKKAVSKDMWDQTGVFVGKSMADESMGFWSEDGAWPSCIDEFVAFVREKRGAGGAGEEMDVG